MNLMSVDGYYARIDSNSDTDLFRGEILGLSSGADFYGANPDELRREFSSRFNLRIPAELHEQLAMAAEAQGKSLHALAQETLQKSVTT